MIRKFLILFLFFSCSQKKYSSLDLIGNWYYLNNDYYEELYFDEDEVFTYNIYSGNLISFDYFIRNDSIYRNIQIHGKIEVKYEFYDNILKVNSRKIVLKDKEFHKLSDSLTLEKYIKDEISLKEYNNIFTKRALFEVHKNL